MDNSPKAYDFVNPDDSPDDEVQENQPAQSSGAKAFDFVQPEKPKSVPVRKSAISATPKAALPEKAQQKPMSWADVGESAVKSFVPDVVDQLAAIGHAAMNPTQTGQALGQLGSGIKSKVTGAFGVQQDAAEKAKNEALLNAVVDEYKDKYGSIEGLKRALATHPAAVLTDISTVLGGGGAALKAAGALGDVSALSKAGQLAANVAGKIDPVTQAVNLAGKAATLPVSVARHAAGVTSGVSPYLQEAATKAGASMKLAPKFWDTPERQAFNKFYSGQGDPAEYIATAQNALKKAKSADVAEYIKNKGDISGSPDFQIIHDAINNARSQTQQFAGSNEFAKANEAIDDAERMINDRYFSHDPQSKSMEGVDTLKQAIWDLRDSHPNSVAQRHLGSIYNAAKQSLVDANPKYANLMDQYSLANKSIKDAQKYLSIGDNASATAALVKGIKSSKTASGEDMLNKLSQHEPTLPFMLSGYAANPTTGGLLRTALDVGAAGLAGYQIHPLAGVATALAGSPRVVGKTNYLAGMAAAPAMLAAKGISKIPAKAKMAYYAGAVGQEAEPPKTTAPAEDEDWEEADWKDNEQPISQATDNKGGFNVGNIRAKEGFKTFDTPEEAVSATANLAQKYPEWFNNGEPMTVRQIAHHWAPKGDKGNDPDKWAENVGKLSGIDPDKPIDLKDLSLLPKFVKAIHQQEKGIKDLYPDEVYHRALGAATGGRIERASGGKVDHVDRLVNKLINQVKVAKKVTDQTTEPLLNAPDEAIVKALSVANQAI